ncbi:MAG: hypothetical protein WA857_16605 [Candidatus Acidiferrum sp.]
MSRKRRSGCVHPGGVVALNEEIEEEESDAEKKEEESGVDVAAREAAERGEKLRRDSFEAGLFADAVERADDGVTGKTAAEGAEFVMGPDGKIAAITPHKCSAKSEGDIAEQS